MPKYTKAKVLRTQDKQHVSRAGLQLPYKKPCCHWPPRVCCHTLTTDWLPAPLRTRHLQVWDAFGWDSEICSHLWELFWQVWIGLKDPFTLAEKWQWQSVSSKCKFTCRATHSWSLILWENLAEENVQNFPFGHLDFSLRERNLCEQSFTVSCCSVNWVPTDSRRFAQNHVRCGQCNAKGKTLRLGTFACHCQNSFLSIQSVLCESQMQKRKK